MFISYDDIAMNRHWFCHTCKYWHDEWHHNLSRLCTLHKYLVMGMMAGCSCWQEKGGDNERIMASPS